MADEKMNTGPEENPQPSLFDNGPEGAPAQDAPAPEPPVKENTPEQAAGEPLAQDGRAEKTAAGAGGQEKGPLCRVPAGPAGYAAGRGGQGQHRPSARTDGRAH